MKRVAITLLDIAERDNLMQAAYKASKGKRYRSDVRKFMGDLDNNLNRLSRDIRLARLPYGQYRSFLIFDPKKRLIHAACFEDRIFHHALMNLAGGILERAMTETSYACRPSKGIHKAIIKVQQHLRQYKYYGKIDINGYFPSIEHQKLLQVLMRRFKGAECTAQLQRIVMSYQSTPQHGLPIGSLTSQYFANYYLDGLDRYIAELPTVRAQVRYMDDIIWWCDGQQQVKQTLQLVKAWLQEQRSLQVKNNVQLLASRYGVTYCGFRILQGTIRLSRRRKRRYQQRFCYWEQLYLAGEIDELQLQLAYAAVHAISAGTDSLAWRQHYLRLHPSKVL